MHGTNEEKEVIYSQSSLTDLVNRIEQLELETSRLKNELVQLQYQSRRKPTPYDHVEVVEAVQVAANLLRKRTK